MPKITDEKRAARKAQILEAAWTCFQKEGLHATTMDDIIRASGLSTGAVYSYFPSKTDLILAAVTTTLSGLAARVAPLLEAEPALPPGELVRQIAQTVDRSAIHEGYDLRRIALLGWCEAQRNDQLKATMETFYRDFRMALAGAVARWNRTAGDSAKADADATAKALLSLILGHVVQVALLGDVGPDDLALAMA